MWQGLRARSQRLCHDSFNFARADPVPSKVWKDAVVDARTSATVITNVLKASDSVAELPPKAVM